MTTAQKLEEITDNGLFERLVTSVLRKAKPGYANIVHTGINAAGKTIKDPVDGYCLIPGSNPPHFVMVAHTTEEKDKLEHKWLHDHSTVNIRKKDLSQRKSPLPLESNDGDLLKAVRKAEKRRKTSPDATFTIILSTNKALSSSLMDKVYEKAGELSLSVDFWEQSKLADFLDTNAEGQYLRRMYLGIEAEMLSESLLSEICQRSLALYEKELFVSDLSRLSLRESMTVVEKGLNDSCCSIQLLVGNSGFGKTVLAYQMLQKYLACKEYGIWLPAESVKDSISLEDALDKRLRGLYPYLLPDSGRIAQRLFQEKFQTSNSRFLIIVDDLNKTDSSENLLHSLLKWAMPIESDSSSQSASFPFLIVCPVWPQLLQQLPPNISKSSCFKAVYLERMSLHEARMALQTSRSAIQKKVMTDVEADKIVEKLGRDPILIGLFCELYLSQGHVGPEDVIEQFISKKITELALKSTLFSSEYQEALSCLTSKMLQCRKLNPLWREVQDWFRERPDVLNALRELAKQEQLCRVSNTVGQERFEFRHDRLREALLIKSVVKMLEDSETHDEILWDPSYAEILAQAILRSRPSREFIHQIRNKLPLVLFEALRRISPPEFDYHHQIVQEIKKWAGSQLKTNNIPNSVLDAICLSLMETDSPVVLEITEIFPQYRLVMLARLRNGCARSGARYCYSYGDPAFMVNDSWRDRFIEHAKQRHGKKLVKQLKQLLTLSDITDEERRGALALAGFLKEETLQGEIAVCWEQATDKTCLLAEAIWAASYCCNTTLKKTLDPMMIHWANLIEEEKKEYSIQTLHFGMRDICNRAVNYFINQCRVHESLWWAIIYFLSFVDLPHALEFTIKETAALANELADKGGFSPYLAFLEKDVEENFSKRKLSDASMSYLEGLWQNPSNDKFLRDKSFRLWLTNASWEQTDHLKTIPSDSNLFKYALYKRIQLADYSVLSEVKPILLKEFDPYLSHVIHNVWCDELKAIVESHLKSRKHKISKDFQGGLLDHHYNLAKVILKIPKYDAEYLLNMYWESLGFSRIFIQVALYVGTPKCLELADSSIRRCPQNVPLFKQFGHILGYKESGRHELLTEEHVTRLLPYLNRIEDFELSHLADLCQDLNMSEWSRKHLAPRLSEESRKRYHPSDNDLLQRLDEMLEEGKRTEVMVIYWWKDFEKRHDSKDRALCLVDQWLASNRNVKGLRIMAACLQSMGTRQDLSLLDKYEIEGVSEEILKIKKDAEFAVYRRTLE